jgi:lipopolysaccharide export system protein LptA
MTRFLVLFLLLAWSFTFAVQCQQQTPARPATQDNRIYLDHADSLVGTQINGEDVRELYGNVKFHQGRTFVDCDHATQYLSANRVELQGNVEVHDDSMRMVGVRGIYDGNRHTAEAYERVLLEDKFTTLRAQYGKYFTDEKKAYFMTDVSAEDTTSILTSEELTYYREKELTLATGNVKIVNSRNGLTIFGDHFENYRKEKRSLMLGSPMVQQIDTSGSGKHDTLFITAVKLESFQDTMERLIATDSVVITRGGLSAQAGISTMFTKLDSITLFQSPVVWYTGEKNEENQVSGDSIFIKLLKRKPENVYVRSRAVAISRADSVYTKRFNQMTGQEIILHFIDGKVRRIDVNRTATSLYFYFDDGKPNGVNKISGDHVVITFADGKMEKIKVYPGVEGEYYPEKMLKDKDHAYDLQGFRWLARPQRHYHTSVQ